jgi:hypothetical protein
MVAEYALLSRETYSIENAEQPAHQLPEGWRITKIKSPKGIWGNCFVVFVNDIKKQIVLSVRGTENLFNILTDLGLAIARIANEPFLPAGQKELDHLVNSILKLNLIKKDGYNFKIIGHSLGGVMAELAAVKFGVECISFESPGSLNIMRQYPETYLEQNFKLITSYLSAPNVINTLNSHAGQIYRMRLPHTINKFNGWHATECVLNAAFTGASYLSLAWPVGFICEKLSWELFKMLSKETLYFSLGAKLASKIVNNHDDLKWLLQQHSIANIAEFLSNNNNVVYPMVSWPEIWDVLQDRKLVTVARNFLPLKVDRPSAKSLLIAFAKDFVPLQKDQPGMRNIFDENGMREAEVRNMAGYMEETSANNRFKWLRGNKSIAVKPMDLDKPVDKPMVKVKLEPSI